MAFESGFRTTLAKPLAPTDTTMFLASVPTVTKGRLFLDSGAQQEWIEFDGISGSTVTNLVRGLSKTADPATAGTGLTWLAGSRVRLVAMHDELTNKQDLFSGNNNWTGTNTFTTANITNATIQNFIVEGQVKLLPVVADEAARDVLYPTPEGGNAVYVQSLNAMQIYNESTVQRESLDVGTPTPEATETVKGIARYATQAEADLGVNDDSTITPAKMKRYVDQEITIVEGEIEHVLKNSDYLAGETIADGDSLFREDPVTFAQATTDQLIGDVNGNTRASIRGIGSGTAGTTLKLSLAKVVSPSVDLGIRIETDNAGKPSGTLVDPNATATIAPGDLTTSLADTTVTLAGVTSDNEHGVTLDNTEATQTAYKGVKITLTQQVSILTVVKDSDCTATKCYLYNEAGDLLTSASFVAQTATLSYNGLVNGQSYYVLAGSDGSAYTSVKQTGATTFPYVVDRMDYIDGGFSSIAETINSGSVGGVGALASAGGKFTAKTKCKLTTITFHQIPISDINGRTVWLKSNAGSILYTTTISSLSATFNYELVKGVTYRVEVDVNNSNSRSGTVANWDVGGNVEVLTGSASGLDTTRVWHLENINTAGLVDDNTDLNNITNITTSDTILIPKEPVHIVLYQGTYGSETVNATNHYKFGYSTNHTTTRGTNVFDGTDWGTIAPAKWAYVSSTLFTTSLLSKTSASYTYKLPDIPRISTGAYTAGQQPKYDFDGITKRLSGLTVDSDYYVSNTPGALSTAPGTLKLKIGEAKDTNELLIAKRFIEDTEFDLETELRFYSAGGTGDIFGLQRTSNNFQMQTTGTYFYSGAGWHVIRTQSTNQEGFCGIPGKNLIATATTEIKRQDVVKIEFEANISFETDTDWRIGFGGPSLGAGDWYTENDVSAKVLIQHKSINAYVNINTADNTTQSLGGNLAVSNYNFLNNYKLVVYPGIRAELYINGILSGTKTTNIPSGNLGIRRGLGSNETSAIIGVNNPKIRIKYS